jgi:allantoicase
MSNLIMPGRGVNMGDGWETKRNRTPGNRDWVIVSLAHRGLIEKILIDTCHFKGNYPDRCSIEGCDLPAQADPAAAGVTWQPILPESKLQADKEHEFVNEIINRGPFTAVRLNIFPDGGISRMRIFGKKSN